MDLNKLQRRINYSRAQSPSLSIPLEQSEAQDLVDIIRKQEAALQSVHAEMEPSGALHQPPLAIPAQTGTPSVTVDDGMFPKLLGRVAEFGFGHGHEEQLIAHIDAWQRAVTAQAVAQAREEVAAHQQRHIDQLKAQIAGHESMFDVMKRERDAAQQGDGELPPLPECDLTAYEPYGTPDAYSANRLRDYGKVCHALGRGAAVREYIDHGSFATRQSAPVAASIEQDRADFEDWYSSHSRDIKANPIGSYECALMWAAWVARSGGCYKARGDWKISPQPWGIDGAAPVAAAAPQTCTCPSGDGSLRWPCPSHPPADAAPVEANRITATLTVPDAHDYNPIGLDPYVVQQGDALSQQAAAPALASIVGDAAAAETVKAFGDKRYQQGRAAGIEEAAKVSPHHEQQAAYWRAFERVRKTNHIPGAGHGRRFKIIEICPISGEETEFDGFETAIRDIAIRALNK